MKKLLVPVIAGSFLLLAGCGEKTQVTVYKQGQYQGKPDKQPWDNAQFKSDRAAWEKTIKARNVGQNEYVRISGN
ncbi:MAG: hypothetical protein AB7E73_17430 [Burkholderiales bacterium]